MLFIVGTIAVHETFYFGGHLLARWAEVAFARYKISRKDVQVPSSDLVRRALKKACASHFVLQPVLLYMVHQYVFPVAPKVETLMRVITHLAACQFSESLLFFTVHRGLHTRVMYSKIHKVHHEFKGSVSIASEHAHPVEQLLGNYLPVMMAPLLLGVSLDVWITWLGWRLFQTHERHSGFDFSGTWLGQLGLLHGHGARYHDLHHASNNGNYGSGMDVFDVICRTRVW